MKHGSEDLGDPLATILFGNSEHLVIRHPEAAQAPVPHSLRTRFRRERRSMESRSDSCAGAEMPLRRLQREELRDALANEDRPTAGGYGKFFSAQSELPPVERGRSAEAVPLNII